MWELIREAELHFAAYLRISEYRRSRACTRSPLSMHSFSLKKKKWMREKRKAKDWDLNESNSGRSPLGKAALSNLCYTCV